MRIRDGGLFGLISRGFCASLEPPDIEYLPAASSFPVKIGFIGCNSESFQFLTAYLRASYDVVAFSDRDISKARSVRDAFYPSAKVFDDYRYILDNRDIDIVVIGISSFDNIEIMTDAILAGKHILGQKRLVENLDEGEKLVRLAREKGIKFAVNMDARWAPSWRYATCLIRQGLIGDVSSFAAHAVWNHSWIKTAGSGEQLASLTYDFSLYWYDFVNTIMNDVPPVSVYTSIGYTKKQTLSCPLLIDTVIQYDNTLANIKLDADAYDFGMDLTCILGDDGVIVSEGPDRQEQKLWFISGNNVYYPELQGDWLPGGFHGTMAELIKSIEEDREPENSAASALVSIAMSFASIHSVRIGKPCALGIEGARSIHPDIALHTKPMASPSTGSTSGSPL